MWTSDATTLAIPTLNTDEDPSPLAILMFIHKFQKYGNIEDETAKKLVVRKALLGKREAQWAEEKDYEFEPILKKIIKEMRKMPEWVDVQAKLLKSERFDNDIKTHILYFKLIAEYMGLKAEASTTKRTFVKSLGPQILPPSSAVTNKGRFLTFHKLEKSALMNADMLGINEFESTTTRTSEAAAALQKDQAASALSDEDESVAVARKARTTGTKRRRFFKRCRICRKSGQCWHNPNSSQNNGNPRISTRYYDLFMGLE